MDAYSRDRLNFKHFIFIEAKHQRQLNYPVICTLGFPLDLELAFFFVPMQVASEFLEENN